MEPRNSILRLFIEEGCVHFDRVKIIVPSEESSEEYYGRGQLSIYERHWFRLYCEFDFERAKDTYRGHTFELKWPNFADGVQRESLFDIVCYQNIDGRKISWQFSQAMLNNDLLPLVLQYNSEFLCRNIEVAHDDEVREYGLIVECFVDGKSLWNVLDGHTFVIEAHKNIPEVTVNIRSDEHTIAVAINSHDIVSGNLGKNLLEALSIVMDKSLVPNVIFLVNGGRGVYNLFSECRISSGVLPMCDSRYGPDHIVKVVQEFLKKYCYYIVDIALEDLDKFGDIWYFLKQIRDAGVVSVDLENLITSVVAEAFTSLPDSPKQNCKSRISTDIKKAYRLVKRFICESDFSEINKKKLENSINNVLKPDKFKELMEIGAIRGTDFNGWKALRNIHAHLNSKSLANKENIKER